MRLRSELPLLLWNRRGEGQPPSSGERRRCGGQVAAKIGQHMMTPTRLQEEEMRDPGSDETPVSGLHGPVTVYLRDVGGEASDGQWDECWVPCAKGDPGAVVFRSDPLQEPPK